MAVTIDTHSYFFLFSTGLLSILLVHSFLRRCLKPSNKDFKSPPSPPALPIIGHLHLLSIILPKCFQALASRYGPLMKITIGASTSLVVSNAKVAREVLKIQDLNYSNRPRFPTGDYQIYKRSSFFEAEYGAYWRFLKKICMTELLSAQQLNRFADIRKEEFVKLLEVVLRSAKKNEAFDVGAELMSMTNNVVCRMTMSTRCSEGSDDSKKIREFTDGIVKVAAKLSLGEVWGPLKKFDLFGFGKKLKAALTEYDELVERIMVEHESNRHGGERKRKDMMDILLEISEDEKAEVKLNRNHIKAFLLVSLAGFIHRGHRYNCCCVAMDISRDYQPAKSVQQAQRRDQRVVGSNRLIEESDAPNLPYLQAVVKEGLRLHPPSPMILRQNNEACKINSYDVAAKSRTIINAYAVMRDPDSWEDPSEFVPERYSTSARESHEFHYLPFGSGRRACPGSALALAVMHVVIGSLVQCFDWKVKGGEKVNMEIGPAVSGAMLHPLECYPTAQVNASIICSRV
ncbi:hypothetical protein RJ639_019454 [Escallonia herrerae]|uniref:Cytochrome P450 n=1 Tax=Escallonia herrerae TaxID=1293975 RepID=A0AA88V884_9ASTE|nr:hypothetical protein RJ639_019454 [Escallonia herrerae]